MRSQDSCSAFVTICELLAHGVMAHRIALEHFHAHDMNRVLVGVNASAELNMVTFVSLELFRIHHIPAFSILIDEGIFVAIRLNSSLQGHQRSLRSPLISLGL